jgi:hypothetical protein
LRAQRDRFNQQKMMSQVIQQRRMSEFQAKQAQQMGQEMAHASPGNSTASLPNNPNMPPPPAGNIVHTPQSVPASLPNQPPRVSASPSFSPQQMQRQGPGPDQSQQPGDQPMMGPPMPGNGQQVPGQPAMNRPATMAMSSAMIASTMNALGLGGRDPATLTLEERVSNGAVLAVAICHHI